MLVVPFLISLLFTLALGSNEIKKQDPNKIVGGYVVSPGQYPWTLGIWYKGRSRRPFCGASLINDRWALTAAHCVYSKDPSRLKIVAGDHNTLTADGEESYEICGKRVHHGYSGSSITNDIALLELCDRVELNHRVQAIPLAPPNLDVWKYGTPTATVAGWGTTRESGYQSDELRAVNVPIVTNNQCNNAYGFINQGQICAGELNYGGKDSCQGDSGGPLWWKDEGSQETYLIGVVSAGNGCARPSYPGIYARVTYYYDWIQNTMAKDIVE